MRIKTKSQIVKTGDVSFQFQLLGSDIAVHGVTLPHAIRIQSIDVRENE